MRWNFYIIKEWDGEINMVCVTFLGHKTCLSPDMVKIRYKDGAENVVEEKYFYDKLFVRTCTSSELNPR